MFSVYLLQVNKTIKNHARFFSTRQQIGLIRAAAILAIDNRFGTLSLEVKCLGKSFGGAKRKFSFLNMAAV